MRRIVDMVWSPIGKRFLEKCKVDEVGLGQDMVPYIISCEL